MPESAVIDSQAIENLRALSPGDDDAFLREVVTMFLDDAPKRIAELDHSLATDDITKFTRAAHSIKGSSANLGAMALHAAAERLECHSRARGLQEVAAPVAQVKAEFDRAQMALLAFLAK